MKAKIKDELNIKAIPYKLFWENEPLKEVKFSNIKYEYRKISDPYTGK